MSRVGPWSRFWEGREVNFENYWEDEFSSENMGSILKCRKCRNVLVDQKETSIIDRHNEVLDQVTNSLTYDCGGKILDVWYLLETEAPEWVLDSINKADWRKGKLSCPRCNARVGSFDFISGSKCSCSSHVLPPIHVVKSKLDIVRLTL